MIIAGIDPSLNNFGLAKGVFNENTSYFDLTHIHLESTEPDKNKRKVVRVNSMDLQRAKKLYTAMQSFIKDADLIIAEVPVGSQSSRAMASYGICIGLISSIHKPLIEVTPNEVKLIATGSKQASKADMIQWAVDAYPEADWLTNKRNGHLVISNKNEHIADAVAAVHAGIATDTFQQLLTFQRTIL